jgi:hypothetical protein
VDPAVLDKVAGSPEALLAELAEVVAVAGVDLDVDVQRVLAGKLLAAELALIRPLKERGSCCRFKSPIRCKALEIYGSIYTKHEFCIVRYKFCVVCTYNRICQIKAYNISRPMTRRRYHQTMPSQDIILIGPGVRLQNRRSRVRIPPGCKAYKEFIHYIAVVIT